MTKTSNSTSSKDHILFFCTHDSTRTRRTLQLEQNRFTVRSVGWEEKEHMDFSPEVSAVLVENEIPDNRQLLPLCQRIRAQFPDVPILVTDLAGSDKGGSLVPYTPYYFAGLPEHGIPTLLNTLIRNRRLLRENLVLYRQLGLAPSSVTISDAGPSGRTLNKKTALFGKWNEPVLICGERGAGKNIAAQLIHQASARAEHPFHVISCHSTPDEVLEAELFGKVMGGTEYPGKFTICRWGTIFLDNVDSLTLSVQKKLAEFLGDRTYRPVGSDKVRTSEVRILVSMRKSITVAYEDGRLCHALYNKVVPHILMVPPLRKRIEEIESIARHLLGRQPDRPATLTRKALAKLESHAWPGNLTELELVLAHAVQKARDGVITDADIEFLPRFFLRRRKDDPSLGLAGLTWDQVEAQLISETLEMCRGNRTKAARFLGVSEKTIYNKIKLYGLSW